MCFSLCFGLPEVVGDECMICLSDMLSRSNAVTFSACGHSFHRGCMQRYKKYNEIHDTTYHKWCPKCRQRGWLLDRRFF